MCGISCSIALKGQCRPSEDDGEQLSKALDESLKYIHHRGPDSKGQWISDHCRVGMSRLTNCFLEFYHSREMN
jgi:asparagine synthase (glutamine-hydrolysing)